MQAWIRIIPMEQIEDEKEYFLSNKPHGDYPPSLFYAKDIKGKTILSCKPGIAIRFPGPTAREHMQKHTDKLVAVEVPHDADKRWRRRVSRR